MRIELITKYYTVSEIAAFMNISNASIYNLIKNLEITTDLKINDNCAYSYEKMRKICGFYEFEKSYEEIMNSYKQLSVEEFGQTVKYEIYEIYESEMNKK